MADITGALALMQQAMKCLQEGEAHEPEDPEIEEIEEEGAPAGNAPVPFSPAGRKAKYQESRKRVRKAMKSEDEEEL